MSERPWYERRSGESPAGPDRQHVDGSVGEPENAVPSTASRDPTRAQPDQTQAGAQVGNERARPQLAAHEPEGGVAAGRTDPPPPATAGDADGREQPVIVAAPDGETPGRDQPNKTDPGMAEPGTEEELGEEELAGDEAGEDELVDAEIEAELGPVAPGMSSQSMEESLDHALSSLERMLDRQPELPFGLPERDGEDDLQAHDPATLPVLDQVVVPGRATRRRRPVSELDMEAPTEAGVRRRIAARLASEIDIIVQSRVEAALEQLHEQIRRRVADHIDIMLPEIVDELQRCRKPRRGSEPDDD